MIEQTARRISVGTEYYWLMFLIAVILLGLYVVSIVVIGMYEVDCLGFEPGKCVRQPPTAGVLLAATTVNGLISALVVSVLAATEPGVSPMTVLAASVDQTRVRKWAVNVYLVTWLLTGLAAFVLGSMIGSNQTETLRDIGQIWLGTSVAAMYAYFGISSEK